MREYTHRQLLDGDPTAGLNARLSFLVQCCRELVVECVQAVEDDPAYFSDLRFAIATTPHDLEPGGPLAAFLGIDGDLLPEALERVEACYRYDDLRASVLLFSLSDISADYAVLPDEILPHTWTRAMNDLRCTEERASA